MPEENFFRVSRDKIISIGSVSSVSKHFRGRLLIRVSCNGTETEINISSTRRDAFLKWLGR